MAISEHAALNQAVAMIRVGLGELVFAFGFAVDHVQIDHDFRDMQKYACVRIKSSDYSKLARVQIDRSFGELHEQVNDAIYRLLAAFIPEEDIKEAVADELLSPAVLDHLERIANDSSSVRG